MSETVNKSDQIRAILDKDIQRRMTFKKESGATFITEDKELSRMVKEITGSASSSSVKSATSFDSENTSSHHDSCNHSHNSSFHSDESYYDELEDFNVAALNED